MVLIGSNKISRMAAAQPTLHERLLLLLLSPWRNLSLCM